MDYHKPGDMALKKLDEINHINTTGDLIAELISAIPHIGGFRQGQVDVLIEESFDVFAGGVVNFKARLAGILGADGDAGFFTDVSINYVFTNRKDVRGRGGGVGPGRHQGAGRGGTGSEVGGVSGRLSEGEGKCSCIGGGICIGHRISLSEGVGSCIGGR